MQLGVVLRKAESECIQERKPPGSFKGQVSLDEGKLEKADRHGDTSAGPGRCREGRPGGTVGAGADKRKRNTSSFICRERRQQTALQMGTKAQQATLDVASPPGHAEVDMSNKWGATNDS